MPTIMIKRAITLPEPSRKPFGFLSVRAAGLLLLSFLAALLVAAPLQAQAIAVVRPEPAQLALGQGETAALEIRLENARDLYGIDVRLAFDPAVLEVIDADPVQTGVQMAPGSFPSPDLVALNAADNTAGTARYVVTQLNPTPPASGSGVVFTVQVRARAAGQTELAIPLVEMSDRDGKLLAVTTGASTIEVRGDPAAATGIAIQPPGGGAAGESSAPTATVIAATAAAATSESVASAPPTNPPPTGQTTGGATPIAPATAVAQVTGEAVSGVADAAGTTALQIETAEPPAETTGSSESEADGEASDAISAAISAVQAGEVPATAQEQPAAAQEQPAAAPQVIGESSNPASGAPDVVSGATPDSGRLSTGAIIAVVIALGLAGFLLLARLNKRG